LVGTSTERILFETRRLLGNPLERAKMSRRTYPFGDGRAAPRIAAIIEYWMESRGILSVGAQQR
jgi:UDP-N-acetylglucosamine 2-epimerase (non-hydrolysing)